MSALSWIISEAKRLKKKYPKRYTGKDAWRKYVKQASAIYASKHKGKSPVGHKRKKVTKKKIVRKRARKMITGAASVGTTINKKLGAVPVGSLKSEIKRRKKEQLNNAILARHYAKKKTEKRKAGKRVRMLMTEYNKL